MNSPLKPSLLLLLDSLSRHAEFIMTISLLWIRFAQCRAFLEILEVKGILMQKESF